MIPVGFFIYKKLTMKGLYDSLIDASTTGVVMVMVFCMMILSRILIMMNLPAFIIELLSEFQKTPR